MATFVTGRMVQNGTVSSEDLEQGVAIPPGAVMSFAMSAAPVGWLACDGSAVSRTQYAGLFAAVGTTYGIGNNSTTFNVPNLQGQFVRGLTTNQSTASRDPLSATRVLGNVQGDAIRNITGTLNGVIGASGLAYTWGFQPGTNGAIDVPFSFSPYNVYNGAYYPAGGVGTAANFDASLIVPTAPENRPVNIALLYCIKY